MNLPGGVRCSYCGTHFPPALDFELDLGETPSAVDAPRAEAEATAAPSKASLPAGLFGALILLLLKGKSILSFVTVTFGSMGVFVASYATVAGWKFALGLAVSILIHEMGHVVVLARHGIKASAPMFIPFAGAVIFTRFPDDPTIESESGAGGPAAGLLAALACAGMAALTREPFWVALAYIGFAINLFNLIPFPPLDGSRITSVFSPGTWTVVLILLLLWTIKQPSPLLWFVLIVGFLFRLGRPAVGRHSLATPATRVRMAAVFLGLCIALGYGAERTSWVQVTPPSAAAASAPSPPTRPAAAPQPPARVAPTPVPTRQRSPMPPWLRWMAAGVVWILATGGWLLVALLLAAASREVFGRRGWDFVAWMSAGSAVATALIWTLVPVTERLVTLGALAAALAVGFVYAAFHAAVRGRQGPDPRYRLTWHCLVWAAAAALAVGYAFAGLWIATLVLLGSLVFFARRPWLLLWVGARFLESCGVLDQAARARASALALGPDPGPAAELWREQAVWYVRLGQGERALQALERAAASGELTPGSWEPLIAHHIARISALVEMDRHAEALAACEEFLRTSHNSDVVELWVLLVREQLARLALHRGWTDEAHAQVDVILRELSNPFLPLTTRIVASARRTKAQAYAADSQLDEARAACERARKVNREPDVQAAVAVTGAEIEYRAGNPEAAVQQAQGTLRTYPDHLEGRYWLGRALRAAGRVAEGEAILRALAEEFPRDRSGAQARDALAAPA